MSNIFSSQLNIAKKDDRKIVVPEIDETSISVSEELVRENIEKLNQNSEEIKKLKEQINKKKKERTSK